MNEAGMKEVTVDFKNGRRNLLGNIRQKKEKTNAILASTKSSEIVMIDSIRIYVVLDTF